MQIKNLIFAELFDVLLPIAVLKFRYIGFVIISYRSKLYIVSYVHFKL